ncbi:hypothetical protein I5G61_gp25 [Mycobacterium phage Quesadilla]|uniref:Tail assembly chaperone n=1 Tax=Mycobacterium phage Quesadilla TaxID=2664226 RepID=A0A5Q2WF02_9CAUD|nr:hypothetical protein I5G61_gp25 [Mycobacterium phage Quesadilla]QGH75273.1 hypothetical protein SEA_QUESADILLA_25 [Mycobacterium phage Quesadilla]
MAKITIEGSLTPAAGLARGERRTVQDSKEVRDYVRRGFAVVVDEETGEVEETPLPEPVKAPAKSASAEKWREFLGEQEIEHDPDANREELIEAYERHVATSGAPAADES